MNKDLHLERYIRDINIMINDYLPIVVRESKDAEVSNRVNIMIRGVNRIVTASTNRADLKRDLFNYLNNNGKLQLIINKLDTHYARLIHRISVILFDWSDNTDESDISVHNLPEFKL